METKRCSNVTKLTFAHVEGAIVNSSGLGRLSMTLNSVNGNYLKRQWAHGIGGACGAGAGGGTVKVISTNGHLGATNSQVMFDSMTLKAHTIKSYVFYSYSKVVPHLFSPAATIHHMCIIDYRVSGFQSLSRSLSFSPHLRHIQPLPSCLPKLHYEPGTRVFLNFFL